MLHYSAHDDFSILSSPSCKSPIVQDSPTRNPCKIRTCSEGRPYYRNDPYGFKVVSSPDRTTNKKNCGRILPPLSPITPNNGEHVFPPTAPQESKRSPVPRGKGITPPRAVQPSPIQLTASPKADLLSQLTPSSEPQSSELLNDAPVVPPQIIPHAPPLRSPVITLRPKKARKHPVVVVSFKHSDGVYELPEHDPEVEPYDQGDYVVVEGDRGEHIGRIVQCNMMHRHVSGMIGRIIRHAVEEERVLVESIRQQEGDVKVFCQKLADEMEVEMRIVDVEIQTDFNKLSIYYLSRVGGPVDFRQLQRRLFREFHCRIWFVNWDDC